MENKKEPIKIKLSTAILIAIILILIILIIGITFYYQMKIKSNTDLTQNNTQIKLNESSNEKDNITTNNSTEEMTKKINLNDELVQKLYNYIPAIDDKIQKNAYQDKKVTLSDLKDEFLLRVAFTKLSLKKEDKKKISDEYDLDTGWYSFDANILQDKVKELYGENANIQNQSFDDGAGFECNYHNGVYDVKSGGGTGEGLIPVSEIINAYSQNDEINIVTKSAIYVFTEEDENGSLYTDSTLTNKIKDYNNNKYNTMDGNKIAEDIIKNDDNLMVNYKHTFKKDTNGNYYWVSTEPIK